MHHKHRSLKTAHNCSQKVNQASWSDMRTLPQVPYTQNKEKKVKLQSSYDVLTGKRKGCSLRNASYKYHVNEVFLHQDFEVLPPQHWLLSACTEAPACTYSCMVHLIFVAFCKQRLLQCQLEANIVLQSATSCCGRSCLYPCATCSSSVCQPSLLSPCQPAVRVDDGWLAACLPLQPSGFQIIAPNAA